jgi:hypothetical protein
MDPIEKWSKHYLIELKTSNLKNLAFEITHKRTKQTWILKFDNVELFNDIDAILDSHLSDIHNQVRNTQLNSLLS